MYVGWIHSVQDVRAKKPEAFVYKTAPT